MCRIIQPTEAISIKQLWPCGSNQQLPHRNEESHLKFFNKFCSTWSWIFFLKKIIKKHKNTQLINIIIHLSTQIHFYLPIHSFINTHLVYPAISGNYILHSLVLAKNTVSSSGQMALCSTPYLPPITLLSHLESMCEIL